ncbi:MAG: hypothetical protein UHU19_10965 [Lachnospiraceae bacterium]|nr:hypothetical protein [Lachnospiraceae bacterium]
MKKTAAFHKNIKFDELILALKYFMNNNKIGHVSGLCDTKLLKKDMTEKELSEIFNRALEHEVFVQRGEKIYINIKWYHFLEAWSQAETIVTLHKPSYAGEKIIVFGKMNDFYFSMVQDAEKNEVLVMADSKLDILYQEITPELKKKDVNAQFELDKVNKELEQMGINDRFKEKQQFQLVMLSTDNRTGHEKGESVLFHVGKKSFEMLTGEVGKHPIERAGITELDDRIKQFIVERCKESDGEKKKQGKEDKEQENQTQNYKQQAKKSSEPYTKFSFENLVFQENFPHSIPELLKMQFKNIRKHLSRQTIKKCLCMFGIQLLFGILIMLWNMYGMCYLNDSFRMDGYSFLGSATAYLFSGVVGRKNTIKGLTLFHNAFNTILFVGPLYFLLGIVFRSFFASWKHGGFLAFFKNLFRFPNRLMQYSKNSEKKFSDYIWRGILFAAPIGLLLFNPFTVGLLALLLFFSCVKADDSNLAVPVMVFCCAARYNKVKEGRKKTPVFADIQLQIFGISVGFMLYTVVNAGVWFLFNFNLLVRVIFTILLMLLALIKLGMIKTNKAQKTVACLVLVMLGSVLVIFAQNGMVLYADDGGWTESGGTLWGLMANLGFSTILGLSVVLGICALAGAVVPALILGGLVAGGAFIWSSSTESGHVVAVDFMLGDDSPYDEEQYPTEALIAELIGAGLNVLMDIGISQIPILGPLWKCYSFIDDGVSIYKNISSGVKEMCEGDVFSGSFHFVCAGLEAFPGSQKMFEDMEADSLGKQIGKIIDESGKAVEKEEIGEKIWDETKGIIQEKMEKGCKKLDDRKAQNQEDREDKPLIESYVVKHDSDSSSEHSSHYGAVGREVKEQAEEKIVNSILNETNDNLTDEFDMLTYHEAKTLVDEMIEQVKEQGEEIPAILNELKEYMDSVGEEEIDRNVLHYILNKN